MIEKRIDQNFQNLFENKYGYTLKKGFSKSIFEQLEDCDRASRKTLKETMHKATPVVESMFGGKALSKKELCKNWNCTEEELNNLNNTNECFGTDIQETLADGHLTQYEEKIIDGLIGYMMNYLGISDNEIKRICEDIGMKPEDIEGLIG